MPAEAGKTSIQPTNPTRKPPPHPKTETQKRTGGGETLPFAKPKRPQSGTRASPRRTTTEIAGDAHSALGYVTATLIRSAVERHFEIIGEATRRLANDDQSIAEKITGYQTIIGLRNRIAHEYDNIANQTVWNIIQNNLPTLLTEITTLLKDD